MMDFLCLCRYECETHICWRKGKEAPNEVTGDKASVLTVATTWPDDAVVDDTFLRTIRIYI
jgi:hypothetical protein